MQTNRAGHRCVDNKFHVKEIRSKMYVFCLFTLLSYLLLEVNTGPAQGKMHELQYFFLLKKLFVHELRGTCLNLYGMNL